MKWTHADEQLARATAEHHSKHPCTKNFGRDSACVKNLDTPLFEHLRTVNECYECVRGWMEEYKSESEEK